MHCRISCVHEYHEYKQVYHSRVVHVEMLRILHWKNRWATSLIYIVNWF